jgi:anionic cell wall polymer biosynthesis LytR-Cps2A-Psr (LCP) family protein
MQEIKHHGGKDASIALLAAIVLLLVGGIIVAVYSLRSDPLEEILTGDRVISVLYIIEQNQKPLSTYVLMCYPKTRRAAIFDIPGEIGVLLQRVRRVDRIDSVYNPQRVQPYENEIERLLGVDITFTIVMNAENMSKAVDLIKGVELFIPSPVNIRGEGELVLFPSGISRLDGDKAVSFINYQAADEDREMAVFRRQRFFLGFLKRQAEMNNELKNQTISQLYQTFMQTSLNQRTRTRLFDEFAVMDLDRVNIQVVGGNLREVSGITLLIPYYDGNLVKEIVRQTLGTLTSPMDGAISDRVFTVEVLNGTSVNGLAGRTAEVLRGFGYDIISISNADNAEYEKTLIIDRSGLEEMAKNFAGIIRCTNISFEAQTRDAPEDEFAIQNMEYRSDFTLIIGRDFNGRYVTGN